VTLGLHPRERKVSATRRLDMAAKAPRALLVCPTAQDQADQGLGGDALGALVCPSSKARQTECQGACLQAEAPALRSNHISVKQYSL